MNEKLLFVVRGVLTSILLGDLLLAKDSPSTLLLKNVVLLLNWANHTDYPALCC